MSNLLNEICDKAKTLGASFADARSFDSEYTSVLRQDFRADKLNSGMSSGIGIRVIVDKAWGFASASNPDREMAFEALETAIAMAKASSAKADEAMVTECEPITESIQASYEIDPRSVPIERKMAALEGYEQAGAAILGSKLVNSVVSYSDRASVEHVCNTFGVDVSQESVRTILSCMFVARNGSILQKGRSRAGSPGGFELVESTNAEGFSIKAAKLANSLLTADLPPAGKFPVVFHPSITGLLTHEAIGHNAEADHVISGGSIIAGKLGEKIASELVTIIDDATIPNKWGSYRFDSEGTPSQRRVIIENGVLKEYMHSLETAAKLGFRPNGSARAQDYQSRPIIRMSNTFISPGKSSFEDLIKDIDLGVYLCGGEYGYVFCERGQYTCHAGEAYMIRNGQVAEHLRDVSVAGLTLETLMNIDAVGSDFEMKMPGMCGKDGQGMHVDNGGPHVRVKELVVGGRV